MIKVTGRVVDEEVRPMNNVRVVALANWLLTTDKATKVDVVDGRFTLEFEAADVPTTAVGSITPSIRVRVVDLVGRQLSSDREVFLTQDNIDINDITVLRADVEGLLVTNRSGKAKFVSEGNAIKLLIDGEEAFGRVADEIQKAQHSINMTQLFFGVPKFDPENEAIDSETNEPKEKAQLVFKFDETKPPIPVEPYPANEKITFPRIGDQRPERLLLNSLVDKNKNTTVRILMNEIGLGLPEGIFWLSVLTALAAIPVPLRITSECLLGLMGVGITFFPLFLLATLGLAVFEFFTVIKALEELSSTTLKIYFGPLAR